MELNRNSKYNKYYLFFNSKLPNNFCDYFWGSVKSLLITIASLIGIFIVGNVLIGPITLLWYTAKKDSFQEFCQISGFFVYFAFIVSIIIYKIFNYFDNKPYKPRKESIIKTWYRDFKNKHCTMITWKG